MILEKSALLAAHPERSARPSGDSLQAVAYRTSPCLQFRLGDGHSLVYLLLDHRVQVVANDDMRVLSACGAFKTLTDHEEGCRRAGLVAPGSQSFDGLGARLQALAERGLLSRLPALAERTTADAETRARLSWLTIPAMGDIGDLTRCLLGCLANSAAFGHVVPVLISDDSPDSADRTNRRAQIRKAAQGSAAPVYYVDRVIRRNLADRLAQDRTIPRGVVEFALFGSAEGANYGANRNAILLYTGGSLALSLDQDMICRTGRTESAGEVLRCIGQERAEEIWFCRDHDEALKRAPACDIDVIAEHERVLGSSVSTLVADAIRRSAVDLDKVCRHLLTDLAAGTGRVRVTVNGLVGDCGTDENLWVRFGLSESSRRRLATDEQRRVALTSRQIVRQACGVTISHGAPWGAMAYSFDNRALLPPFLPTYRSEDTIWRLILARYLPGNYFGHLPWTLTHAPARPRCYAPVEAVSVSRMVDLVITCLSTKQEPLLGATDDSHPLQSLGALLMEFGSLDQRDFDESMRLMACQRASSLMQYLHWQRALADREGDRARAEDLAAQASLLENAVVRRDFWVPIDACLGQNLEQRARTARERLRQYGELLWWWPAIVTHGRQVLESGELGPDRVN